MIGRIKYTGNQAIISSDRVHIHAKRDKVIIYGNKGIELYSGGDVRIQALSSVKIDTVDPKGAIELGYNAKEIGSPVTKADELTFLLKLLLERLSNVTLVLRGMSYQNLELTTPQLALSSENLFTMVQFILSRLDAGDIKSEKTYTV